MTAGAPKPTTGAPGGKTALPLKRRQPRLTYRETPDVVDGVVRLIASIGERVATEDPEDLAHIRRLEEAVAQAWRTAVDGQRHTFSDREIADVLGVTRPAVTMRWPRRRGDIEQ